MSSFVSLSFFRQRKSNVFLCDHQLATGCLRRCMLGRGWHRGAFDRRQEHPSETRRVKATGQMSPGVDDSLAVTRDFFCWISRITATEAKTKMEIFHDVSFFFIH